MSTREAGYLLSEIVQLDETYWGGPNGKQGRGTKKSPAYVAVSTEITDDSEIIPMFGKIQIVDKTNHETACNFLKKHVEEGSTVITDYFRIYDSLPAGFEHLKFKADSPEGQKALDWLHTFLKPLL